MTPEQWAEIQARRTDHDFWHDKASAEDDIAALIAHVRELEKQAEIDKHVIELHYIPVRHMNDQNDSLRKRITALEAQLAEAREQVRAENDWAVALAQSKSALTSQLQAMRTALEEDAVRNAFEAWRITSSSMPLTRRPPGGTESGEYVNVVVHGLWLAWRDSARNARAALKEHQS